MPNSVGIIPIMSKSEVILCIPSKCPGFTGTVSEFYLQITSSQIFWKRLFLSECTWIVLILCYSLMLRCYGVREQI